MSNFDVNKLGKVLMDNPNLIEPFGNYIVIELLEMAETTLGGVLLPDEVRSRDRQILARVISVGPGQRSITTGERMALQCDAGDLVIILKHAPIPITLAGKTCHVIAEGDLIGRVDENQLEDLVANLPEEEPVPDETELYDLGEGVQAKIEERESGLLVATGVGG